MAAAALFCSAAPALASKPAYRGGLYTGTVSQLVPKPYAGTISFKVHKGRLTKLTFNVTMVCAKVLIAQVQSPPSSIAVSVTRNGTFSYSGTVSGTDLQLQGAFHGNRVHGSFFESFQTSPGSTCTMLAPAQFRSHL